MSILAVIKREEKKVKKQLARLQNDLSGLQSAAKALGNSTSRNVAKVKKRVLSAAGRAKISKAAKKRWAKIRTQAKKAVG
jgi:prophage DNA circulation protein